MGLQESEMLVTGASGFVGTNLTKYFTQKSIGTIYPISLRQQVPRSIPKGIKYFIHLAGKAHDTNNISSPEEYFQINTELTKQLFDVYLQSPARDFIYFSSVKAAADKVSGILTEDIIPDPQTPYGQSKLKAEEYILSQLLPEEKRVIILRPCMIHGPGNKGNLNLLYKVVKKSIPYPLAAFKNKRSFLSINNLLFIIEQLLNNPHIPGGIYNATDDIPLSTIEIIHIIGEESGITPRMWKLSPTLIRTLAKVGDILYLPLNSERLKKLTENYVVSNQKIKNALGIQSFPVSSREGLLKTVRSFEGALRK